MLDKVLHTECKENAPNHLGISKVHTHTQFNHCTAMVVYLMINPYDAEKSFLILRYNSLLLSVCYLLSMSMKIKYRPSSVDILPQALKKSKYRHKTTYL
jgi:hypothetical protein